MDRFSVGKQESTQEEQYIAGKSADLHEKAIGQMAELVNRVGLRELRLPIPSMERGFESHSVQAFFSFPFSFHTRIGHPCAHAPIIACDRVGLRATQPLGGRAGGRARHVTSIQWPRKTQFRPTTGSTRRLNERKMPPVRSANDRDAVDRADRHQSHPSFDQSSRNLVHGKDLPAGRSRALRTDSARDRRVVESTWKWAPRQRIVAFGSAVAAGKTFISLRRCTAGTDVPAPAVRIFLDSYSGVRDALCRVKDSLQHCVSASPRLPAWRVRTAARLATLDSCCLARWASPAVSRRRRDVADREVSRRQKCRVADGLYGVALATDSWRRRQSFDSVGRATLDARQSRDGYLEAVKNSRHAGEFATLWTVVATGV